MKSKVHIRLRQESILRQRRRSKAKAKSRRQNKKKRQCEPRIRNTYGSTYIKPSKVASLSSDFRIIENTETVIKELNHILNCRGRKQAEIRLHVNISDVVRFDIGALTCLLSTLRFTKNYQGNEPNDPSCRKYFEDSGFLEWMRTIDGRKFPSASGNNLIFEPGKDKTSNAKVGQEIKKAIKYLTQKEGPFPPVYSIIQEICPNSIEHANTSNKDRNWLMGILYEKDKVCFVMVDKGQGILKTLKRSRAQQIGDAFNDEIKILARAFEKKYQSASEDKNRNKGLPTIKHYCDLGYVNNMTVVTNSAMLNLSDNKLSKRLGVEFAGTFYYWEITKDNYDKWKNKKKSISA